MSTDQQQETLLVESIQQEMQSMQEEMKKLLQFQLQEQMNLTSELGTDLQQLKLAALEMNSTSTAVSSTNSESISFQIEKFQHDTCLLENKLYQESLIRLALENQLNDSNSKNSKIIIENETLKMQSKELSHQLSQLQTQYHQSQSELKIVKSENRELKQEIKEIETKQEQTRQENSHQFDLQTHQLQQQYETNSKALKREIETLREELKEKTNQLTVLKNDYIQDIKCITLIKQQMELLQQSNLEMRMELNQYKREKRNLR